jgi:hypothetical protein
MNPNNFCRTFSIKRYGQICVMRRQDKDGGPEVRLYFQPKGMGVCEFGIGFRDDTTPGDAEVRLDAAFHSLTGTSATELVDGYLANMKRKTN